MNASKKRHRLLALVKSENRPLHAQRGQVAPQYDLQRGDADWFFENISCQAACPAHTDVARYIAHLADGNYETAHQINLEDNLFPGILGRICARPCEDACRRGKIDDPIAICSLKRGATDFAEKHLPERAPRLHAEQVAVVGAGPAGLAAANGLAKAGYRVVVFEAQSVAGGMLRWGIPKFRLPPELCKREIDDYFEALGVEIRLNTRIGQDVTLAELRHEFDAVFLAAGTMQPQDVGISGQREAGVISGLHYMEQVNLQPEVARARTGKRVAVIGGGFTAMDCARAALRLGAEQVFVLYRRSSQELVVGDYEVEEAQHEGTHFEFMVAPLAAKGADEQPVGLVLSRTALGEPGADGRRKPFLVAGSEFELGVDTIIAATGQNPDSDWTGLSIVEGKLADTLNFASQLPGVFAGGDFVAGARNVISAVADGRKAAFTINRWLRERSENGQWPPIFLKEPQNVLQAQFKPVTPGKKMRFSAYRDRVLPMAARGASTQENNHQTGEALLRLPVAPIADWTKQSVTRRTIEKDNYQDIARQKMPVIPLIERKSLTVEVETGFTKEQAHDEAQRCLQCQLNIFIDAPVCILCNTCVDVCPPKVIQMADLSLINSIGGVANPPDLKEAKTWEFGAAMIIDEDTCIRCGECVKWCPTGCLSMQHFEPVQVSGASLPPLPVSGHTINFMAALSK